MAVDIQKTILRIFVEDIFEEKLVRKFIKALAGFKKFVEQDFKEYDLKSPKKFASVLWKKSKKLLEDLVTNYYQGFLSISLFSDFKLSKWVEKALYIQFCKINQMIGVTVKKYLKEFKAP